MNKYKNKQTRIGDKVFASKKEANMYIILQSMQRKGEIEKLKLQPKFTLQEGFKNAKGKKHRPIRYYADFSFYDKKQKRFRVIDCKGYRTNVYKLKRKMFDKIMKDSDIYLEEEI